VHVVEVPVVEPPPVVVVVVVGGVVVLFTGVQSGDELIPIIQTPPWAPHDDSPVTVPDVVLV